MTASVIWDAGAGTTSWSTKENWNTDTEPTAADAVVFPAGLGGPVTTTSTEQALSLQFDDVYTLSGGTLALASGNSVTVASGVTATLANALNITGGLTKAGAGTLVLSGSNTNAGGSLILAGTLRAASTGALGASGVVTTVEPAAILEVAGGISIDRPVTLKNGAALAGFGTAASNGRVTIDAAAVAVSFKTSDAADILTIGNGSNDLTGGSAATVIGLSSPGTVRMGAASDFDGSWHLAAGRLELANATALGDNPGSSVTLAGGTLSARAGSATNFTTSQGNNLLVTASSSLLSDRTSASSGLKHTFGALTIGNHTLTVAPGPNATSGTAEIVLGGVTLAGNPVFAVETAGAAAGKLTAGPLDGGGAARTVTKTGAGHLALTGGATSLPAGSLFSASGGGTVELLFPALGSDAVITVSAAQNPLGGADASVTGGLLRLLAAGSGTSAAQTYVVPTLFTLGGVTGLDPDRISGSNTNKTFELPGLTLAAGSDLTVAGDNTHGVRLAGALALQGDAIIRGSALSSKDGLLAIGGGISGGPADTLTLHGGTSLPNVTINAASTYGGGTLVSGGNLTLNAAQALGPGAVTITGGMVTVNADGALTGPVALDGGTLRVNSIDALAGNPVQLNGGTLDLRTNVSASYTTGALTLAGTSTLNVANNGTGSSQIVTIPSLSIAGPTVLSLTSANAYVPNISGLVLGGDLTLNHTITAQVQGITEDATPRRLLKTGTGTLKLQAASSHSGGTEVLAGILSVEHAEALGGGTLVIGDTAGTAAATVQFSAGLSVSASLLARSGGTGPLALKAPGGNLTLGGSLELQRSLSIENPSSNYPAFILAAQASGPGGLVKTGSGRVDLTNTGNSFGAGQPDAVSISAGTLAVTSDDALGDPANGVTISGGLSSTGTFLADGSFASPRTFTFSGDNGKISVSAGSTLRLDSGIGGTSVFGKDGPGVLEIAAGVDSTSRGAVNTYLYGGTLRLHSPGSLSAAGLITLAASSTILELAGDSDTDFGHPVTLNAYSTVHVDRALGGANGRHSLGTLALAGGTLTVTGDHGYGLSLAEADVRSSNSVSLLNNAPAALQVGSLASTSGAATRTLTLGGTGDITITGPVSQASTGTINLTKSGPGTLQLGTAVSGFSGSATISDGTLDLNGLAYAVASLSMGNPSAVTGPRLVTGAAGALVLAGNLTTTYNPPALISGNLELTAAAHSLVINDQAANPVDCTIDGLITGAPGASLTKSGGGTLRLTGTSNTQPGLFTVSAGGLELGMTGGPAIGPGGLAITGGTVRLLAAGQIADAAAVTIDSGDDALLELDGFTQTLTGLSIAQSDSADYSAVRTGASGTLVLLGNLVLSNNSNTSATGTREVLITGSGTDDSPSTDGTLDLGGAVRTVQVTSTGASASAGATIETRIINGGILKTGPRTLRLAHPANELGAGLRIAEGRVVLGSAGSAGGGSIEFPTTGSAALEFGQASGTVALPFSVSGSGSAAIAYTAGATGNLELAGAVALGGDLTVEVATGGTSDGTSAVLRLSGFIDDSGGGHGLVKTGSGKLVLSPGNTFSGTATVRRGTLAVADGSALGTAPAQLVLDGGCIQATATTGISGAAFAAGGGSVRVDAPHVLELAGTLAWGAGAAWFHGSGTTVISGATTGAGGDITIGAPGPFADGWSQLNGFPFGHVLSLRGSAALPQGNLRIVNDAVLELGSGDFSRPVGTGAGEVQLDTYRGGGWAAHGADRSVNLGGAAAPVVWGQRDPAFLYRSGVINPVGRLILGSLTATHTVDFVNPLELGNGDTFMTRRLFVPDGPAAVEARLSGGISLVPPPGHVFTELELLVDGALAISGPVSGPVAFSKQGGGSVTLSGLNTADTGYMVEAGSLVIASNASLGYPAYIDVWEGARLDASAMTLPVETASEGDITVDGTILGDVAAGGDLYGDGAISGTLTALAGASVNPGRVNGLSVGGFTLAQGALLNLSLSGEEPLSERDHLLVNGAVNLAGELRVYILPAAVPEAFTETIVVIFNDGSDPINGIFDGLPEGALISFGNGTELRVTYTANGDGGPVGNDFGLALAGDDGADLVLEADVPLMALVGAAVDLRFTARNTGTLTASGALFHLGLPAGTTLQGSVPAGTVTSGVLTVPLPDVWPGLAGEVTVRLGLPAVVSAVTLNPALDLGGDINPSNNSSVHVMAVLATAGLQLLEYTFDRSTGQLHLTIDTLPGVRYQVERSIDLENWTPWYQFTGDGDPFTAMPGLTLQREFFRFNIIQ